MQPWRQTAVVLAILLAVGSAATSAMQADSLAPPSTASENLAPATLESATLEPSAEPSLESASEVSPLLGSFPKIWDFGFTGPPVTFFSPVEPRSTQWYFAVAKLTILVVAILLWLHSVHLSVLAGKKGESKSTRSVQLLCLIGFAGIMTAMIFPAYVVGAVVLLLTSTVPMWQLLSQNAQLAGPSSAGDWNLAFTPLSDNVRTVQSVEVELLSGKRIGASGSTIRLLGKSPTRGLELSRGSESSPAFQQVLALIDHVVANRATDLHINTKANQVEFRQRIDGALSSLGELPVALGQSVINIFKVMGDLSIADRRRSQDGSFLADVNDRRLSFRVAAQGTQNGEKLSIRILDPIKTFTDLASLGMPQRTQERLLAQLNYSHGLILFVGTTGAGKSTTACAAMQSIDGNSRNMVSIEDPIEYQIPAVDQIEVNHRVGQTFESALRSVLRLDADIIFVGEIRDQETAKISCQAAQSGQLVLATMHASDSIVGAIRLAELAFDTQSVATSLRAVMAQFLVRKLCTSCRVAYTPDAAALARLGMPDFEGVFYRSPDINVGSCSDCDSRGFSRRTGLYELTVITPAIRELVRERASTSRIAELARENGMRTVREEGIELVRAGTISLEELDRVVGE